MGMIERRDHGKLALARDAIADLLAHFLVLIVEHDLGAIPAGRLELHGRRVLRHDDGDAHAEELSYERHRLRVVAGGVGEDAALAFIGSQPRHRVVGAAKLERSHALEVLALEEHLCAGALVDRARSHHGCAVRVAGEPLRGGGDVGIAYGESSLVGGVHRS